MCDFAHEVASSRDAVTIPNMKSKVGNAIVVWRAHRWQDDRGAISWDSNHGPRETKSTLEPCPGDASGGHKAQYFLENTRRTPQTRVLDVEQVEVISQSHTRIKLNRVFVPY